MDVIELERWKPSETDPRKLEYAGQPIIPLKDLYPDRVQGA